MSIKAIITTLILGTSSIAGANPLSVGFTGSASVSVGSRYQTPVYQTPVNVRDHRTNNYNFRRYDRGYDHYEQQQTWMTLGTVNTELTRESVEFGVNPRYATNQIMLASNGGKTRVLSVELKFANGRTQLIQTDRYLGEQGTDSTIGASNQFMFNIPQGQRLASIVITASKPLGSSFSVYAQ